MEDDELRDKIQAMIVEHGWGPFLAATHNAMLEIGDCEWAVTRLEQSRLVQLDGAGLAIVD